MDGYLPYVDGMASGSDEAAARADAARRQPAPGGLALVQAFLNSADIEAGTDELETPESTGEWLARHTVEPIAEPIAATDHTTLLELREAIRDVITDRLAGEPEAARTAARDVLERAARSSPLRVAFDPAGSAELEPAVAGLPGFTGRILAEIALAAVAGTWPRLKVCRNDSCRWAYYDTSRNHAGVWCSMAICGNRAKGRTYRGRHGAAAKTPVVP
jgi:predicted RNA-binding Zn ribbon-like protein